MALGHLSLAPTPAPTHASTPQQCVNPKDGECSGKNACCAGWSCEGKTKTCEPDVRHLRERKFPFQKKTTEERKLVVCNVNDSCNEYQNEVLCGSALPSSRPESNLCNYGTGNYVANVQTCGSNSERCCEDGNGGYYYGLTCWGTYQGGTCCPKGYTRINSGCVPLNCCDGDADHRVNYCPHC